MIALLLTEDPASVIYVNKLIKYLTYDTFQVEAIHTAYPDKFLHKYHREGQIDLVIIYYPQDVVGIIHQIRTKVQMKQAQILIVTGLPERYSGLLQDDRISITDNVGMTPALQGILTSSG